MLRERERWSGGRAEMRELEHVDREVGRQWTGRSGPSANSMASPTMPASRAASNSPCSTFSVLPLAQAAAGRTDSAVRAAGL
jgi:hypothetical protein